MTADANLPDRIVRIDLDLASIGPSDVNADHERRVAIADLLEGNSFRPVSDAVGDTSCPAPGDRA